LIGAPMFIVSGPELVIAQCKAGIVGSFPALNARPESMLPEVIRQVDRLRRGAPIHVTETGYHTSYNRFHRYFVSEAQQALWVDETMTAAARFSRVQAVTWFNFQDNPFWTGGLLRGDGSRKPSYDRFAAVAAANPPPPGWAR
jgi:hypothetical protein